MGMASKNHKVSTLERTDYKLWWCENDTVMTITREKSSSSGFNLSQRESLLDQNSENKNKKKLMEVKQNQLMIF